jgi:type IV secretory pathway component VirB8
MYVNLLSRTLSIPEANKEDFKERMLIAQFSSDNAWNNFRNIFSIDSTSYCKNINIMVTHNTEKDTYSFLIADIKQSFKLA